MKRKKGKLRAEGVRTGSGGQQGFAAVPFRPRPKLFAILSVMFVAWVAVLVVLYFTTVRGRGGGSATSPVYSASAISAGMWARPGASTRPMAPR